MEKNSEILDELKQLQSSLADISRDMPYTIPQGYFEALPENIITKLKEDSPLQWSDDMPYSVPGNYFDTLPNDLLTKAKAAEITTAPKRKVFSLTFFIRSTAAILILAIGIAGYRYFNQPSLTTQEQLAALSDEEINQYLQQHLDEFDTEMLANNLSSAELSELENIGNDEIIDYLNETGWTQP